MAMGQLDRDARVREALYRAKLLVNRTPHLSRATRREANRALDALEKQLGLNQANAQETARAFELLNRAHPSIAFGLVRDRDFADRFGAGLRRLGLRSIAERLDEVPSSIMVLPTPGPAGRRAHRDELDEDERLDADGNPLPPPPGFY